MSILRISSWSMRTPDHNGREEEIEKGIRHIDKELSNKQIEWITKPYSGEEIKKALFDMSPWKSPGPDGVR